MKGTHRITKVVRGRRVKVGSYIIQITTRFPSCKRLQLTTSVYPETKNAPTVIQEMKLMLKEMNRNGDVERFLQLKNGKLKLIDVYHAYKAGREHLLYGNEGKNLLAELMAYTESGIHAEYTTKTTKGWLATFKKYGLISDNHVVADLPKVVQGAYNYYKPRKKHDMFNLSRVYFLGFLKNHCQHSSQSPLYQAIQRIERLKVTVRKQHNPLSTPHDLFALIQQVLDDKNVPQERREWYAEAILMMTLHPFRPTEFFQLKWERDTLTGHLRIKGTKTIQSNRVVPSLVYPQHYRESRLNGFRLAEPRLNKILRKLKSPVRSRDFRRTYSIWAEKAGIERSHLLSYMGHVGRSQTDLYQRRALTRDELDTDLVKFRTFIENELKKAPAVKQSHFAPTSEKAIKTFLQSIEADS